MHVKWMGKMVVVVKFQQRQVLIWGLHHWLELGTFFDLLMNINWIDKGKLVSFSNQSDQKLTFYNNHHFTHPLHMHIAAPV